MADSNDMTGKVIKPAMKPAPEVGMDTEDTLVKSLLSGAQNDVVDLSALQSFSSVASTREQSYQIIDTMSQDSIVSSILETYAEDTTQTNESGKIVWVDSKESEVTRYVEYLIDSMQVDKNIYDWAYCLLKYGDVYLRLYRESDYDSNSIFTKEQAEDRKLLEGISKSKEAWDSLDDSDDLTPEKAELLEGKESKSRKNEDVNVNVSRQNDHFVPYLEKVPNPGEMFELTRFGKTMGYIQAPINIQKTLSGIDGFTTQNQYFQSYKFMRGDVNVYSPLDFVHACLSDNSNRTAEEVNIFLNAGDYEAGTTKSAVTYNVRRGKSLLNDVFKIWRELSLLENSVLLNRLTKSSIIRIMQVQVGNMQDNDVQNYMNLIKGMVEQKTSLKMNERMTEYTNPGPVENTIYLPVTANGTGQVTLNTVGTDFDPKQLTDISYFQDKFFGALRVPKQFMGVTDDSAGFNGGQSLSIISSRYGKAIKRIQNSLCQMLTDATNIFLMDRGLYAYINEFTIHMNPPITQEEVDKRQDVSNRLRNISDIMNALADIKTESSKLKILKSLLTTVISDSDIMAILDEEINKVQSKEDESAEKGKDDDSKSQPSQSEPSFSTLSEPEPMPSLRQEPEEGQTDFGTEETQESEEETLPSPDELGIDMTQNI